MVFFPHGAGRFLDFLQVAGALFFPPIRQEGFLLGGVFFPHTVAVYFVP